MDSHDSQNEPGLTAAERELARTLASLSPTVTSGVAMVPTRELAARAGAVRSRQKLRLWQAGSVFAVAGIAAAFVMQPDQPAVRTVAAIDGTDNAEMSIVFDEPDVAEALANGDAPLRGSGRISAHDLSGKVKIVFSRAGVDGEVKFEVVPLDWEVCDH
jgi:hypothetical protein